jgi:hypothetical protein
MAKVMKPAAADAHLKQMREQACRMCRCTWEAPCNPPCSWAPGTDSPSGPLCSSCKALADMVADWFTEIGLQPSWAALRREVDRINGNPMRARDVELVEKAVRRGRS